MPESAFGVEHGEEISKLTRQEKKGLIVGGVGGIAGPPGSAVASGYLAPKGKKAKYAAGGFAGGFGGPPGGAAVGYMAATSKKKKKKIKKNDDPFEVEKAFGSAFKIPKMGGPKKPKDPSKAYQRGQATRGQLKGMKDKTKQGTQAVGAAAGRATTGAGVNTAAAGAAMQRNPGKTGAGLLGGGSVALTGGVYANRKNKKPGE